MESRGKGRKSEGEREREEKRGKGRGGRKGEEREEGRMGLMPPISEPCRLSCVDNKFSSSSDITSRAVVSYCFTVALYQLLITVTSSYYSTALCDSSAV